MSSAAAPALVRVRVADLRQLFDSLDPSPFLERDLAPAAVTVAPAEPARGA